MRDLNNPFTHLVLGTLVVLALTVAGVASKRASQPNSVNGPVRVLSEAAR